MMDDGTLASGAEDNLILLWNSGRMDCCNTFTGHTKQVWDVIAMDH
jgi:WD40 repeat protein